MNVGQAVRVLGVDPSLTATGLVVLTVWPSGAGLVTGRLTVTDGGSPSETTLVRLMRLATGVRRAVAYLDAPAARIAAVYIEDPTDQHHIGRNRNLRSVALLSAAFGMVVGELVGVYGSVVCIPAGEWIPKQRKGVSANGRAWAIPQKAALTERALRHGIAGLTDATEHEVMAAGVAYYGWRMKR